MFLRVDLDADTLRMLQPLTGLIESRQLQWMHDDPLEQARGLLDNTVGLFIPGHGVGTTTRHQAGQGGYDSPFGICRLGTANDGGGVAGHHLSSQGSSRPLVPLAVVGVYIDGGKVTNVHEGGGESVVGG